ncbi:MAG: pyridoxine 5'-phosphate synthase [Candidatus Omnitrophica bacterium]|nr:pyridoxine 5'-phosphate synthase [Candidatus Omnitrophota bacterium]
MNVDHVATLRQQRRGERPSPVWAAVAAQRAGADGIVCHLREDRRHIQDGDLPALKRALRVLLNLEMGAHPEIVGIACRVLPRQATLVPERRQELTTEGGLDLRGGERRIGRAAQRLARAGIRVSLFIDPDPMSVRLSARMGVPMVELHTGRYAEAGTTAARARALRNLREASALAKSLGLIVAAGHGLDYENVRPVAAIPEMEELNIGFSIVARAIEVGFSKAVREMAQLVHGHRQRQSR